MKINKIASLGNKINSAFAIHLFFLKLLRWKFQGKNRTSLPFLSRNSSKPTTEHWDNSVSQGQQEIFRVYSTSHHHPVNCTSHLLTLKASCCQSRCLHLLFQTEHVWMNRWLLPEEQPLSAVAGRWKRPPSSLSSPGMQGWFQTLQRQERPSALLHVANWTADRNTPPNSFLQRLTCIWLFRKIPGYPKKHRLGLCSSTEGRRRPYGDK